MIGAVHNVALEQGAAVCEADAAERAGFVSLRGTALRAYHWPQVRPLRASDLEDHQKRLLMRQRLQWTADCVAVAADSSTDNLKGCSQ